MINQVNLPQKNLAMTMMESEDNGQDSNDGE